MVFIFPFNNCMLFHEMSIVIYLNNFSLHGSVARLSSKFNSKLKGGLSSSKSP